MIVILINSCILFPVHFMNPMLHTCSWTYWYFRLFRKPTPKVLDGLSKNQPSRASPRLAKLRSAPSDTNLGAGSSVIDVDQSSPEASPPRDKVLVADESVVVEGDEAAPISPPLAPADERAPSPQADETVAADPVHMGGKASDEPLASAAVTPAEIGRAHV